MALADAGMVRRLHTEHIRSALGQQVRTAENQAPVLDGSFDVTEDFTIECTAAFDHSLSTSQMDEKRRHCQQFKKDTCPHDCTPAIDETDCDSGYCFRYIFNDRRNKEIGKEIGNGKRRWRRPFDCCMPKRYGEFTKDLSTRDFLEENIRVTIDGEELKSPHGWWSLTLRPPASQCSACPAVLLKRGSQAIDRGLTPTQVRKREFDDVHESCECTFDEGGGHDEPNTASCNASADTASEKCKEECETKLETAKDDQRPFQDWQHLCEKN